MISVVVPCFNAEPFLATALDSILAQTRPAEEIIVVDDCSTDRSATIAAAYPVQVLRTAANSGHATARNLAIDHARGDVIAWLDADDYWDPEHLETVVGLLDRFPTAQVAFSRVRFVGARHGEWSESPCDHEPRNIFWNCFKHTVVPAMSAATRRSVLQEAGGFDPKILVAPDFELWLRLSQRYLFVSDPAVTSNYRWHANQISARHGEQIRSMYRSRAALLDRVRLAGENEFSLEIERTLLSLWERDLSRAWHSGSTHNLKNLLSLALLIPNGAEAARRWRLRAMIPGFAVRGFANAIRHLRNFSHTIRTP